MTKQSRHPGAPADAIRAVAIRTAAVVSMAFVSSLLAACGSKQEAAPAPVEDTAFGDMAGAMEDARAVEGTMQQHKEALDRTLQENENPTAE